MKERIRTVFRIYGRFAWPPFRNDPKAPAAERDGAVELLYASTDGGAEWPCLRWLPRAMLARGDPPGAVGQPPNLATLDRIALAAHFAEPDRPACVALDATPSPLAAAPGLVFFGAAVFEQWSATGRDAASSPVMRWPLARSFRSGGRMQLCSVRVGREGDEDEKAADAPGVTGSSVTLQLALATPWAQSGTGSRLSYAFPFRVRYEPAPFTATDRWNGAPLPIAHVIAGTRDGVSDTVVLRPPSMAAAYAAAAIRPEDDLDRERLNPARWRLGRFGIGRADAGGMGLFLPRRHAAVFWPRSASQALKDVFGGLLTYPEALANDVVLTPDLTPRDDKFEEEGNGIWFADETGAGETTILHRCCFRLTGGTVARSPGSDLRVDRDNPLAFELAVPRTGDTPARIRSATPDLLVEVRVTYRIGDGGIWKAVDAIAGTGDALPVTVDLSLGLRDAVEVVDDSRPEIDAVAPPQTIAAILERDVVALRSARAQIANLEPGTPVSLLPEIVVARRQTARFAVCTRFDGVLRPRERAGAATGEVWLRWPGDRTPAWQERRSRLTLWPAWETLGVDSDITPAPPEDARTPFRRAWFEAKLSLPAFTDEAGASVPVEIGPDPAPFLAADAPSRDRPDLIAGFSIAPRIKDQGREGSGGSGRLGSLRLTLGPAVVRPESRWRFTPRPAEWTGTRKLPARFWPAQAEAVLELDVTHVVPVAVGGGEDGTPGPLLLPMTASGGNRMEFHLWANESVGGSRARSLTASLYDRRESGGLRVDYVVLSEQPFGFARVQPQPLDARGAIDGGQVATYERHQWLFKRVDAFQRVSFSPQSVGESMDKPRRFAIVDAPATTDSSVPRPWDAADAAGLPVRRALECRFTPSADLWVRATDTDRTFVLPEWELGRLWRRKDTLGVGVALAALRGEFLYGMPVGIDVAREQGVARTARVAEVSALLGEPLAIPPEPGDPLARALARRPERLELWMREPETLVPAPARFAAGVIHALRDTARHYPALEDIQRVDPRIDDHGLPGGALWPIESLNFLRQLIDRSDARGGTIENIALSPTGGDADQRAEFLDGRLAIISETRNGFVQRHRVEILGRIAVFWHRAKHVVVYERTANASAQFPFDHGAAGSRRPIVRKVSEFIELLQPERRYPDAGGADLRSAGFLRGVRFNQKTINVDSAWSEDLGLSSQDLKDKGWRIPLWNRGFAEMSPQVYARPDIAFVTSAEGEGEAPEVAQECLDPDNLFFYAEVAPPDADSDLWPARAGTDFSPVPRPLPAHQRGHTGEGPDASETRQASAPRVPRGHRRFTWHLAPANRRTAINAGRGKNPVYAALETLTFSRAMETGAAPAVVAGALADLTAWPSASIPGAVELAAASRRSDDDVRSFATDLRGRLSGAKAAAGTLQEKLGDGQALHGLLKLFTADDPCGKLKQDFARTLQGRRLLVLDTLRTWLVEPTGSAWGAAASATDRATFVAAMTRAIDAELARTLGASLRQVEADVGDVRRSLAAGRAFVRDFGTDVRQRLARCGEELDRIDHAIDAAKPWSLKRLATIEQQIGAARDGLVADIGRAAEDAVSRLATELGIVQQWVGPGLRREIARVSAALVDEIVGASGTVAAVLAALRGRVRAMADLRAKFTAAIDRIEPSYPEAGEAIARLRAAVLAVDAPVADAALARAESGFAGGTADLTALIMDLHAALEAWSTAAQAQLGELNEALAQLPEAVRVEIAGAADDVAKRIDALVQAAVTLAERIGEDAAGLAHRWIASVRSAVGTVVASIDARLETVFDALKEEGKAASNGLAEIAAVTTPDKVLELISAKVVTPAVDLLAARIGWPTPPQDLRALMLDGLSDIEQQFDGLLRVAEDLMEGVGTACDALKGGLDSARNAAIAAFPDLQGWIGRIDALLNDDTQTAEAFRDLFEEIGGTVDKTRAELEGAVQGAQAYADRVFEAAGSLTKGGLGAAPGHILNLWAAAASAPRLPNLDVARERLGYYYDAAKNLIDTTPAGAWFGRLGDELKALGITLPFKGIEDRLVPAGLKDFDVGRIFRNFGGLDLSNLFKGVKLPEGAGDAVKVTHAFDRKQVRAWVQIDVDLPMPGRKPLFAIGPFTLDFIDPRLQATVRLEASKDSDKVAQTGSARLTTDADAVVGGQSMVTLRELAVRYDKEDGLKIDLDPKNIRINPSLRFIQDALASIVPDQAGGLKIVKDRGVPVGVEHDFSMPPISLMAGTSGVSNIAISNHFTLVAYPDFRIANRFALSSPELPFLFSIFVIGGTGYLVAESEYRPFGNELAVTVEAAAGGSAALGFSAGPISGSVFVSLSIAIAYRKAARSAGGGLTVSVMLLISGNVDVAGIASVYIGLLLRMAYRDDGAIDGQGDLHVRIRISRFFTYSVRQNVRRQLRGATRGGSSNSLAAPLAASGTPAPTTGAAIIEARG
jgi:ElaB/YqjD/DUF883 family membrane-anchored ribosome-binding protein